MWTIDPIAHVGGRGQRLEAVQEARRNVQVPKVVVVEQKCLLLAEGRRVPSNVDQNVAARRRWRSGPASPRRAPSVRACRG